MQVVADISAELATKMPSALTDADAAAITFQVFQHSKQMMFKLAQLNSEQCCITIKLICCFNMQRDPAGAMNSLGTFLLIEMGKFNKLLKKMRSTLVEVQRAIKGTVVMSADLDAMSQVCWLCRLCVYNMETLNLLAAA
jgi:hypothetical protein